MAALFNNLKASYSISWPSLYLIRIRTQALNFFTTTVIAMAEGTVSADVLFEACAVGNLEVVRALLADPAYVAHATNVEDHIITPGITHPRPIINLSIMFNKAAAAGAADLIEYLLSFARVHGVEADALIHRDSVSPAIKSINSIAVFKKMVAAKPEAVDEYLGHDNRPLTYAIRGGRSGAKYAGERAPLVQFLLENGADPNRVDIAYYKGPGVYLEDAVRCASLEIIKLLLKHGAQIEQSGAMQQAAQLGRIDVMELLAKHGANVNEQLKENDPMQSSKRRTRLRKLIGIENKTSLEFGTKLRNEAPLHVSVFSNQPEATRWLTDHGADADVVDSQGWSPRDIAIRMGDKDILEALGDTTSRNSDTATS
jgi:hypothetical protein